MKVGRVLIGVGLAIVALSAVGLTWGRSIGDFDYACRYPGAMMGGGYGMLFGMHTFGGGILTLLFWGLVVGGLALLAWGLSGRAGKPTEVSDGAVEILRRRFARGEIDQEEFERIKASLLE